jgi:hypothetical protein
MPIAVTFDSSGDLFVANAAPYLHGNGNVTEYVPPYSLGSKAVITNGISGPGGVAVSPAGILAVSNSDVGLNFGEVTGYGPPYTGPPIFTITPGCPCEVGGVAFDPFGDLFVTWYADGGGLAWVAEYASPYTAAPIATDTNNGLTDPFGVAYEPSGNNFLAGNLFVVNTGNAPFGVVLEYKPPFTGPPAVTIKNGLDQPGWAAFGP